MKRKLALYAQNANQSVNSNTHSTGMQLNGFSSSSSPSTTNDIEMVNRCFSSCSPHTAASPSSLSSGTPPLTGNQSIIDCTKSARTLCNVSPVSIQNNSSSFMLSSMRDYSFSDCLNSTWSTSLVSNFPSLSPTESNLLGSNALTQTNSSHEMNSFRTGLDDNPVSKSLTEFDLHFTTPSSTMNDLSFANRF